MYFPVLLRTAKIKFTSQYYFVRQSLNKALPSTTSYFKCTSQYYFVQQSLHKFTSQYYFVLQSLHKVLPSTTSYYKACTKYFKIAILRQFWRSNLISCKRVATDTWKLQFYVSLNFTDRTSFRAKGLHFVAPRWHCPSPWERNRKEGGRRRQEGKRARGQ